MAVYSQHHNHSGSRTSATIFNAFDEQPQLQPRQSLPHGSCNFRDLNLGSKATPCGCQHFWLNITQSSTHDAVARAVETAWCFCGHHACYHNVTNQLLQQRQIAQERGQQSHQVSQSDGRTESSTRAPEGYIPVQQNVQTSPKGTTGLGIQQSSRPPSRGVETNLWNALNYYARQQVDFDDSETTSKLPSTAPPSVVDDTRVSPVRYMADHQQQQQRVMGPPVSIPQVTGTKPGTEDYSATEVATPSVAGTPDFRAMASPSNQQRLSPGHLQPGKLQPRVRAAVQTTEAASEAAQTKELRAAAPSASPVIAHHTENLLRSYGRRLDFLESLSFNHVHLEELQERYELMDGRIIDIELWRDEYEKARSSPNHGTAIAKRSKRALPTEANKSFSSASDASFDSGAAARTEAMVMATLAATSVSNPRIEALEDRIADLESDTLPSYARPWQVQVVLLPWGRELRGIWFSSTEATQQSLRSATQVSEEWVGANARPKLSFKSSFSGAWTTESIQAWANDAQDWLSPKACGPNGTVFRRLQSRGLVKDISLVASDSRHILETVSEAFDHALRSVVDHDSAEASRYQALCEHFVPLRKVRKSSRLRFLSPAEMVTSATWTASHLESGVFMKTNNGQRRLFITTADAYLQPTEDGWSWNHVRQLPPPIAADDSQCHVTGEAPGALESCWSYTANLDQPSPECAFFSESSWSAKTPLETDRQGRSNRAAHLSSPKSMSDTAKAIRNLHNRSASLPSSTSDPALNRPSEIAKRRIASFETSVSNSLAFHAVEAGGEEVVSKRRRISSSHHFESERRDIGRIPTPRWSREPPSPFTASEGGAGGSGSGAADRVDYSRSQHGRRATTPFAYATPHSNSNAHTTYYPLGPMGNSAGDGDTEVNTEMDAERDFVAATAGEEEWEGVEEDEEQGQFDPPGDEEMGENEESIEQDEKLDEVEFDEGLLLVHES